MSEVKNVERFAKPLQRDCEELLGRFQQTESVRFETFCEIWRDMDFSSVHYGVPMACEKRAFTRMALAKAYSYFLPPYTFQIRTGGLYLLYGVYHTQLAWPKEKIWVALKDWCIILQFLQNALEAGHLDVLYIYRKLVSEKAIIFTAMPNQCNFIVSFGGTLQNLILLLHRDLQLTFQVKRKRPEHKECEEFQDFPARVENMVSSDALNEISHIQGHYERLKETLSLTSVFGAAQQNLVCCIKACAVGFKEWQERNSGNGVCSVKEDKHTTQQSDYSQRADLLAAIKSKSYGIVTEAKSWRYCQQELAASGTDQSQESLINTKRPSLRARTCNTLKIAHEDNTKYWLLSAAEEDKSAFKRKRQKNRFRW
ncbi:snRNA-activating protein complex subunit 1a [Denticeps clupeoides]|uniref:snRNA-activating protein complex subunit 1a n=1 Tax=Denticeps clupeoides TaxID=299321 RepID=UPI0010A4C126|nr:snRNA-activating protein complex subunit 1-like [Denticeps clupeoides]